MECPTSYFDRDDRARYSHAPPRARRRWRAAGAGSALDHLARDRGLAAPRRCGLPHAGEDCNAQAWRPMLGAAGPGAAVATAVTAALRHRCSGSSREGGMHACREGGRGAPRPGRAPMCSRSISSSSPSSSRAPCTSAAAQGRCKDLGQLSATRCVIGEALPPGRAPGLGVLLRSAGGGGGGAKSGGRDRARTSCRRRGRGAKRRTGRDRARTSSCLRESLFERKLRMSRSTPMRLAWQSRSKQRRQTEVGERDGGARVCVYACVCFP